MIKLNLLLTATSLLLATSSAQAAGLTEAGAPGCSTYGCSSSPNLDAQKIMGLHQSLKPLLAAAQTIDEINEKMDWAGKCESFAENKQLGEWGHAIRSEMKDPNRYAYLMKGSEDIQKFCPQFNSMKPTEKANFWILVLNGMTHYESSCDSTERAKGPNGQLIGLLQLHKGEEHRYSAGCTRGDGATPRRTFSCGLSMLDDQLRRDEALFSKSSYWDVLRPQAKSRKAAQIQKAIKYFKPCNERKSIASENAKPVSKDIQLALLTEERQ